MLIDIFSEYWFDIHIRYCVLSQIVEVPAVKVKISGVV